MKKLFLLIPLFAFAMMAEAKVINVQPGKNTIRYAMYAETTEDNDVLVLADGIYTDDNYIDFKKSVEVRAAEGATPIVQLYSYITVQENKDVVLKNIVFDGSNQGSYDYIIRQYNVNSLTLDGCEFRNMKNIVVYGQVGTHTGALNVNNCFFHNNQKQAIYFAQSTTEGVETCDQLTVRNSTFANTTALTDWVSIIDIRPYVADAEHPIVSNAIKVVVDHCTFYNNECRDSGHANIRTHLLSDVTVSNCVFAHPTPLDQRAVYCDNGGTVSNCATYNFTKDTERAGITYGCTVDNCRAGAILFKDPENNNFRLYNASVARQMNGDVWGDPRWATAADEIAIPSVLVPVDALLSDSAGVIFATPDSIEFKVRGSRSYTDKEWAKWKVSVAKDGLYNFTAYAKRSKSTDGQKFEISLLNSDESQVMTPRERKNMGNEDTIQTGIATLEAGKTYIVKVRNTYNWAESKLIKVEASYYGGAITAVPDTLWPVDALRSPRAFVEADSLHFTDSDHEGEVREQWAKWKISVAEAGKYKFTANVKSSNGQNYRITLKNENESSTLGTWYGPNNNSGARKIVTEMVDLTIDNYVVIIEDTVKWSKGRVANMVVSYEGGKTVAVPGQILAKEAVIGQKEGGQPVKMYHLMGSGDLQYYDNGYNMDEFATWTLNVTQAGEMAVTLNVSHLGHMFSLELYQGETRLDSIGEITEGDSKTIWKDGNITLPDRLIFPTTGTYTLKLLNNQAHSGGALHGITFARTPIVIDENATANGNWAYCSSSETIDLSIIRTFKGGMYNTICLPIELGSVGSMNAAFGTGYELLKLSEATLNGEELVLNFETKETLEYGVPHLIKPVNDVINPSFTGRKIKTTTPTTVTKGIVDFIGNFIVSEIPAGEDNLFVGPNDLLYFSSTATEIKGMRAYFKVNVPSGAPAVRRARIVTPNNMPTEIELVNSQEPKAKSQKLLRDGQLYILYNGTMYNVQGQIVK